jgi:hypothetical protein
MVSPKTQPQKQKRANTDSTTSNDPNCACQAAPKKANKKPPPIEATLLGRTKDQARQLNQPGADLDVTFLPVERMAILRESAPGPDPRTMACKTSIQLDSRNARFVNLQGLPDNSLLLSVRVDKAGRDLRPQMKYRCYWPQPARGRLYTDLVLCSWDEMTLQLLLPASRVKGWKTVALIARSFRRISAHTWGWMVGLKDPPAVAGLDWREIESGMQ